MIAMEVGNENMVDFAPFYLVTAHLYLGSLPTIYQNGLILNAYHLSCWMPIVGWKGRIIA
jgi:hypothetical protein